MADTRDEMNAACRHAVDIAFEHINEHGEFVPFAVVILRDDQFRLVALGDDLVTSNGSENLTKLREILRRGASEQLYRTIAVAANIRFKMGDTVEVTDAVSVEVEHVGDTPISCVLPYRRSGDAVEQHIDPFMQPGTGGILGTHAT